MAAPCHDQDGQRHAREPGGTSGTQAAVRARRPCTGSVAPWSSPLTGPRVAGPCRAVRPRTPQVPLNLVSQAAFVPTVKLSSPKAIHVFLKSGLDRTNADVTRHEL